MKKKDSSFITSSIKEASSGGLSGKEKTKAIQEAIYKNRSPNRKPGKSKPEIGLKFKALAMSKKKKKGD